MSVIVRGVGRSGWLLRRLAQSGWLDVACTHRQRLRTGGKEGDDEPGVHDHLPLSQKGRTPPFVSKYVWKSRVMIDSLNCMHRKVISIF